MHTMPGFTSTHIIVQGLLGQWIYHNPQSGSGITRPCVLSFRDPAHSVLSPSRNLIQPKHDNPITQWLSRNGKASLKNIVIPDKNHANESKRTKNTHG